MTYMGKWRNCPLAPKGSCELFVTKKLASRQNHTMSFKSAHCVPLCAQCSIEWRHCAAIGRDLVRGLGGRGRRISAEKRFCRPLQNVKFGGGLTVFANFNI